MGFRFRKSIGGKYFKINISKSGIGYSYGIPGYRKSIMPNGRKRTTYSIPGTGLSYVSESKGGNKSNSENIPKINENTFEINNDIDNVDNCLYEESSHEEFVKALKKAKTYWTWSITMIVLGLIFLFGATILLGIAMLGVGAYLYYYFKNELKVNIEYEIEEGENSYKEFKEVWLQINRGKKIWEIVSESKVETRKNAGASRNVNRIITKFEEVKLPYLNVGNEKVLKLKLRKKEIIFLKDKILIFDKSKIASVDYNDINLQLSDQKFVERENVPKDATIVEYTWEYVNNNGTPDKRFTNNRQIPICLYGKINISDKNETFLIELQMSNYQIYKEITDKITKR